MRQFLVAAFAVGAVNSVGNVGVRAQAPSADVQKVDALLAASKYTATRVNNPTTAVWTIARHGTTIGDFKVLVTTEKGIVGAFVIVAPKKDIRRTTDLLESILKINYDLDYVKAGFDADSDAYVRIDASLRLLDVQQLNEIVNQLGNCAEAEYLALKPFLIR